jgi:hypothetical protein
MAIPFLLYVFFSYILVLDVSVHNGSAGTCHRRFHNLFEEESADVLIESSPVGNVVKQVAIW